MSDPWKDEHWIPGVLSQRQVLCLRDFGYLKDLTDEIDPSAFDLHVTDEGYCVRRGTVKPDTTPYVRILRDKSLFQRFKPDTDGTFVLEPEQSYVFGIKERLCFPTQAPFCGQATPRSSIGRLDVITRLIVNGMVEYDTFNLEGEQQVHDMYVEITPMTFRVEIKEGTALNQLRLFYGGIEDAELSSEIAYKEYLQNHSHKDASLSVDLAGENNVVAFHAKREEARQAEPIKVWQSGEGVTLVDPHQFWETRPAKDGRFTIKKSDFYILKSKERITLPSGIAVYCRAMDETLGEMRIHYAGFVHPWFGLGRGDGKCGTPLIFEVRGHDINVNLADNEKLARLTFYRMSEVAEEPKKANRGYNEQELTLSNYFAAYKVI